MPPPKKVDPPVRMSFTTNSLRNTTISVDNDTLYYEIVTRFWHPTITKIRKLDIDSAELVTIAELEREPGKEPRLRFGKEDDNAEWIPVSTWLQRDPAKVGGVFQGPSNEKYRWKTHNRGLQMVRADGTSKEPLVVHHPHRRHFGVWRMSQHAYLEVKPECVESMDALIMSYLIVERRRRDAKLKVELKVAAD